MQKQFAALHTLITDPAVIVREAGVQGAFMIMGVYLELLLPLFLQIVSEHACDAAAPAVRVAVCDGMRCLVDNHLSLVTLQSLLPRVFHLINDSSDRVRMAIVALLYNNVKGIKASDIMISSPPTPSSTALPQTLAMRLLPLSSALVVPVSLASKQEPL